MACRLSLASLVFVGFVLATFQPLGAQSLDGTWEISMVVDDGRVVEPTDVLLNYAADGRVVIKGQTAELVVPMTFQRKQLPFLVDDTKSPMTLDMGNVQKTGGRGIFMASRDTLVLCLASRDKGRPTSFSSKAGSGNLLVTLTRTSSGGIPGLPNQPPSIPSYEDEQLKRMLVGTWGHQDNESIHYITLGGDGNMRATMQWKDQFKQMFHQDVRSSGTWTVKDGAVIINITQSNDKERRGQVGSFRVRSINGSELVAVDYNGQVRQEWKAP